MHLRGKIHYVGVNDRRLERFERMWSLKKGVAYNAYLIDDEQVALVDSVDICYCDDLIDNIKRIIGDRPVDYLIVNHMEPDHSGSLGILKYHYPNLRLVGNKKTIEMIEGFYNVDCSDAVVVDDKAELSLGHHKLNFCLIPMMHWPETMITFDVAEQVAFTGDVFGAFGALNGGPLDTMLDLDEILDEVRRYYACILGKYGSTAVRSFAKIEKLGHTFTMFCSTHGPVWTGDNCKMIWDFYANLATARWEKGLVVVYGSMYGYSLKVAEQIVRGASHAGVKKIRVHDVTESDPSIVLSDVYRFNGLAIGAPTYNLNLYPPVDDFMRKLAGREVKNHPTAIFGSYGWAAKAVNVMQEYADKIGLELVGEDIEFKQGANQEILDKAYELGKRLGETILADERTLN